MNNSLNYYEPIQNIVKMGYQCISSQINAVIRYSKVLVVVTDRFKTFESLICPAAGLLVKLSKCR